MKPLEYEEAAALIAPIQGVVGVAWSDEQGKPLIYVEDKDSVAPVVYATLKKRNKKDTEEENEEEEDAATSAVEEEVILIEK